MTRRRRRGIKRGESSLASNQFPICSLTTVWNTSRGSRSSTENREERKEIDVTRRRGGQVKRRETNLACDQFPVFSTAQNTQRESQS